MITYYYNEKTDILEVKYQGRVDVTELIDYGDQISMDQNLPGKLKVLTDVSEAEYAVDQEELPQLLEALKRHVSRFDYIKAAFIQSKPYETAVSYLLEDENRLNNYFHKVFSKRDAAVRWLLGR